MIQFSGSAAEAEELVRLLPAILSGEVPDHYGVAEGIKLRAGVALLSEVQHDFVRKSRGERGTDGIKWPPLSPKTIAYGRRATANEKKALGIGKGPRPTLTAEQDEAWRRRFWVLWSAWRVDLGDAEAKRRAAAAAWNFVKQHYGAKTKLELLGNRKVDILRDTGELFRSLAPGVGDRPSGADGQIFETGPGFVTVGTNKKPWHQNGDPSRGLPARPIWPQDGRIPAAWMPSINDAVQTGVAEAVVAILGAGNG